MAYFIFFIFSLFCLPGLAYPELSVGIVGGGIGGTASAYYLRKLLGKEVDLTIFEPNSIGGRLRSVNIDGRDYEAGGSILIPRNRYMVNLLSELGLKKRDGGESTYAGLYDGKQIVFAESKWMIVNIFRLLWRYGFSIHTLNDHIGQLLNEFDIIYHLQEQNATFDDVPSLLNAMNPNFVRSMGKSAKEAFTEAGFSDRIIQELVGASLRVNYGQTLTAVHKFVGSVAVAGTGGGLWSVAGGNQQIPQLMAEASGAKIINSRVEEVERIDSNQFQVKISDSDKLLNFDVVIIAAPQTTDSANVINFKGFPKPIVFSGRYHRTVCTMLIGEIRLDAFPGANIYTDEIISFSESDFFNSISRIFPVDANTNSKKSNVWKVFSQEPLTNDQLRKLFKEYSNVTITDWLAYPHYGSKPRSDYFILAPGLYHINAIEWAASAMEMILIGARNIANLVRNKWFAEEYTRSQASAFAQKDEL